MKLLFLNENKIYFHILFLDHLHHPNVDILTLSLTLENDRTVTLANKLTGGQLSLPHISRNITKN